MTNRKAWKPEWNEALESLSVVTPRLTNAQVAYELNRMFGNERHFSKDVVKSRRRPQKRRESGLPMIPAKAPAERRAAPNVAKIRLAREAAAQAATPIPDLFAPDLSGLPGRRISDLKGGCCKFEISGTWNKRAYRFCGAPVVPLPPYAYCSEHARVAYEMPKERERQNWR